MRLRSAAFAASFGLFLAPDVRLQSPSPDSIFLGATPRGQASIAIDRRDGSVASTVPFPSTTGPVRVGLRGRLWAIDGADVAWFDRTTRLAGRFTPSQAPVEIEPDGAGGLWVATDASAVEHWAGARPTLTRTVTMPAPVDAITVDADGRLWAALDNQPAPLLSSFDATNGRRQNVTVNALAGERIGDLIADDRKPAASHIWLVGGDSLFEFDDAGVEVRAIQLTTRANSRVERVALGAGTDVWAWGNAVSLTRVDAISGDAQIFYGNQVGALTIDQVGDLWIRAVFGLERFESGTDRIDLESDSVLGRDTLDDGAGYYTARVAGGALDTDGDGFSNRRETREGTNPFDAQSTPALHLQVPRIHVFSGEEARIELDGSFGLGFLAIGQAGPPVAVPGILGDLRLRALYPIALPIGSPGVVRIPATVPAASLWFQAVQQPFGSQQLRFSNEVFTRIAVATPRRVSETFHTDVGMNREESAGFWGGGRLTPARLGGTGRLGPFKIELGQSLGNGVYLWDTESMTIPGRLTLTNADITVTDGVFEFSSFHVPAGQTVVFAGSNAAVLRVRGEVRIDGEVRLDGSSPDPTFDPRSILRGSVFVGQQGESGALSGAGGGRGGAGADGCEGQGAQPRFSGRAGENLKFDALSGYFLTTNVADTGGGGGPLHPASGLDADVQFNLFQSICGQVAGGGGGGGWMKAGLPGRAIRTFTVPSDLGPDSRRGRGLDFVPVPAGYSTIEHFLAGGSGGGGGGSQPLNMSSQQIRFERRAWHAGGAGAGGGGALAMSAGRSIVIETGAAVSVRGGDGVDYANRIVGPPAPGGGGAGGTALFAASNNFTNRGTVDISGGRGSKLRHPAFNGQFVEADGGAGAPGYVRLELASIRPNPGVLGQVVGDSVGPNNVGVLADDDSWTGAQSTFRLGRISTPDWLHYELTVEIDGRSVVFSDDPDNFNPASGPGVPVQLLVQGAKMDLSREVSRTGPWRSYVSDRFGGGLNADGVNGLRFLVLFDRSVSQNVRVTNLDILHR